MESSSGEMKIDLELGRIYWSCGHLEFMQDVKLRRKNYLFYIIPLCDCLCL